MAETSEVFPRAQDVIRCQLCPGDVRRSAAQTVCNTCHVNICQNCVGYHMLSLPGIKHDVVTFEFKKFGIIQLYCREHKDQKCELFCEECNSPICLKCLNLKNHENHHQQEISETFKSKQKLIKKDLDELETIIAPIYESILCEIRRMSSTIAQEHGEREQAIYDLGKKCHKIVDNVIQKYQKDSTKKEVEDLQLIMGLQLEFEELNISLQSAIFEMEAILDLKDSSKLINYTSKNENFRNIPSRFELTVPKFNPKELTEEALSQIFGDIPDTIKTNTQEKVIDSPQLSPSSEKLPKSFLDLPLIVGEIKTDEKNCRVACIPNTDQFYISGFSKIIKHMNTEGELLEKISTKTDRPSDLTVTKDGNLVYIDGNNREINFVESSKIKDSIELNSWIPGAICSTSTGDILVHVTSPHSLERSMCQKVLRFSGSKETQEIELSDISIFSPFIPSTLTEDLYRLSVPYIVENKNLDIVVNDTNEVLVLNREGKFRFRYPETKETNAVIPCGVTTDNLGNILVAYSNNIIHIINLNGKLLMFIDNCNLNSPCGLSIDSNGLLFVAEPNTHKVKQIKYME